MISGYNGSPHRGLAPFVYLDKYNRVVMNSIAAAAEGERDAGGAAWTRARYPALLSPDLQQIGVLGARLAINSKHAHPPQ